LDSGGRQKLVRIVPVYIWSVLYIALAGSKRSWKGLTSLESDLVYGITSRVYSKSRYQSSLLLIT
jgi:hypothetical protein